jgi:hypothetical protein
VAKFWKKIGVEKTWINDLEEVKSVEKCQCGKKRDKFPWKNITYLVVIMSSMRWVKRFDTAKAKTRKYDSIDIENPSHTYDLRSNMNRIRNR